METEARIYARDIQREVKRLETLGAAAFKATTWPEGCIKLFNRIPKHRNDAFTAHAMQATRNRLEAIPVKDRGFSLNKSELELLTLSAGGHTLTHIEDLEEGVYVQRHCFTGPQLYTGLVTANISTHALGRYWERSPTKPTVEEGINFVLVMGYVGRVASSTDHLKQSELNLPLGAGLYATGSMKIASYAGGGKLATAFYDVRTVLPVEALDEERMQQATMLGELMLNLRNGAELTDVPAIARRIDLVMETLNASKRKPH